MVICAATGKKLAVNGINRSLFQGSFVIRVFAAVKGDDGNSEKEYYLEHYWVLNHRNTIKCANCLTHLDVASHFPLTDVSAQDRDK